MKKLIYIFALVSFFSYYGESLAQTPTYTLKAKNFVLKQANTVLEFDIVLTHTDLNQFEYAGGQYFISFNQNIFPCSTPPPPFTDTSNMRYQIIGSGLPANLQPRTPSVGMATNPSANILNLAVNTFPGAGSGFLLPPTFDMLIAKMRLHSKCGPFNPVAFALAWRNPPVVTFSTKVFAYIGTSNTDITTPQTHTIDSSGIPNPLLKVNLRVLMEAMYNPASNLLSRRDTVCLFLRNAASPYIIRDTAKKKIDTVSHSALFTFNFIPYGQYYLVIKHHNCIETWSKAGGENVSIDSIGYNFNNAVTQAYGNNQIQVDASPLRFAIYSGDVNQDGIVDGADLAAIDNDSFNFAMGYRDTDLNGDGFVDGTDTAICDNNAANFVAKVIP